MPVVEVKPAPVTQSGMQTRSKLRRARPSSTPPPKAKALHPVPPPRQQEHQPKKSRKKEKAGSSKRVKLSSDASTAREAGPSGEEASWARAASADRNAAEREHSDRKPSDAFLMNADSDDALVLR